MTEKRSVGRARKPRPDTIEGWLGEAVEVRRKAMGWTSQQLAEAAGVGLGTIGRVESGEGSPSIETVVAIARSLGVT